jgi:hypothetical protein
MAVSFRWNYCLNPTMSGIWPRLCNEIVFRRRITLNWTLLVLCAGFLIGLILIHFIRDQEITAGVERLAEMRLLRPPVLNADPNLKRVSERSPYMRTER